MTDEPQEAAKQEGVLEIRTTDPKWMEELASAYKSHHAVLLINDAKLPIDPATQNLVKMGRAGGLSKRQWLGVVTSLGIGLLGAYMIVAAIIDPEPTSKLGLLIVSGVVLALSGGFATVKLLTNTSPPNVRLSARGFEISWEN